MATFEKPRPTTDPDTERYWQAMGEGKLLIKHCNTCELAHFYPRELCPHCHSDQVEWREATGLAEVYSYTVCRRPAGPAFADETPYVVAIVTLTEGPRMMTRLLGPIEAAAIGARVHVRFQRQTDDYVLPFFERTE